VASVGGSFKEPRDLIDAIKRGGRGVGRALIRRIMERFGGAVELVSQEKAGTTVRLIFKLA